MSPQLRGSTGPRTSIGPHTSGARGRAGGKHRACTAEEDPDQAMQAPDGPCYSRKRSLLLHGKSSPLQMLPQAKPQPHGTQEHGEMTGNGSGQAELPATPADTNGRGAVGSAAHQPAEDLPGNGTTSQEGPTHTKTLLCRHGRVGAGSSTTVSGTQVWLYRTLKS